MPAFYCDSSALVKCYRQEAGTAWMRQLTAPNSGNTIYIAQIAGVEVVAAITRQRRRGLLVPADAIAAIDAFRQDFQALYYRVALSEALIFDAMSLAEQHGLRGYDAVQLAAALQILRQRVAAGLTPQTFVSADAELNVAAAVEGFIVEDSNQHP